MVSARQGSVEFSMLSHQRKGQQPELALIPTEHQGILALITCELNQV